LTELGEGRLGRVVDFDEIEDKRLRVETGIDEVFYSKFDLSDVHVVPRYF
jgi:hypothetical protein